MSNVVESNILNDPKKQAIRNILVNNGLDAPSIKATLGSEDDIDLNTMLLNMPTNKCSNLNDYGVYLNRSTNYSELLFRYNLVNSTRKWRFKRYVAKQKVYFYIILK